MNPPIELTEFVPEDIEPGTFRTWALKASAFDDNVEIRNVLFSSKLIVAVVKVVAFASLICGIAVAFVLWLGDMETRGIIVACVFCLVMFIVIVLFIVGYIQEGLSHVSSWKEKFRFRYNKTTGELFFPRENICYAKEDYDTLILGTTNGYNTVKMMEQMVEQQKAAANQNKHQIVQPQVPPLTTETYFLVRQTEGTWSRHLIGYDQRSRGINRAVANIQKAMQCRTVKRTMSLPECYATQHKTEDTTSTPLPPELPALLLGFFTFCFAPVFMIAGLGIVCFGFYELHHARASLSWETCEGTITHSEVTRHQGSEEGTTYGVSIRYGYTVGDKKYTADRYRYGYKGFSSSGSRWARGIVDEHPVGAVVKVYYSPDKPAMSVLVPGPNRIVYLRIGMGAIFFLVGVGVVFLIRYIARSTNFSAPYTPSEPEFGIVGDAKQVVPMLLQTFRER